MTIIVSAIIVIIQLVLLCFVYLMIKEIRGVFACAEGVLIISMLMISILVLCYPLYILNQKCPDCSTIRAAADYCTECGHDFGSKKVVCKSCTERQSNKHKFCQKCGDELITNETERN